MSLVLSIMNIWQVDFYHHEVQPSNNKQWELIICNASNNPQSDRTTELDHKIEPIYTVQCPPEQANAGWLEKQILIAAAGKLPDKIQVFRPQLLGLIGVAIAKLNIKLEPTRNTENLKQVLRQKYQNHPNYNPLALEKPPPQPLPEELWGDRWQIANIAAGQIIDLFSDRPIPITRMPAEFFPINLNLTSDIFIPGIVIYGGNKSMLLARWIEQQNPTFINYIPTSVGKSGGFVLETGLVDRWIFNTFESESAATIAVNYERKKQASKGLHFLLIQPDDSGMTTTAFWLLKSTDF